MSVNSILDICKIKNTSIEQKIIEELLNNNNLETKTELSKPVLWGCITITEKYIESKHLPKAASMLSKFTEIVFKYLISKDRKGRLEYLEAFKTIREENSQKEKSVIDMG